VLEMGSTRHRPVPDLLGALKENPHALKKNGAKLLGSIPGIHAHKSGDLIVPASAGTQRAPKGFTDPLDKNSLERAVDVLIRLPRVDSVAEVVLPDGVQSGENGVQVLIPQVTGV